MGSAYTILVVASGTVANLLIAAMFLARVTAPRWSSPLGLAGTAMALPLAGATILALVEHADGWMIALPLVFVAFAVVEVLVDVVLDVEVRATGWLWPYLLLFYLAQWALIGAAFLASPPGGGLVLVTYFVSLAATAWSYRRVGHGTSTGSSLMAAARGGHRPDRPRAGPTHHEDGPHRSPAACRPDARCCGHKSGEASSIGLRSRSRRSRRSAR